MVVNNPAPDFYTKKYLPSKKIMIIIGVLAVGGIVYAAAPYVIEYYQTNRAAFSITGKPPEPLIVTTPAPNNFDLDTDGDGIKDWQETLFALDPKEIDSNNDGVMDALPTAGGTSIGNLIDISEIDKLTLAVYDNFQNTLTDTIAPEQVELITGEKLLDHAQNVEAGFKKYTAIDLNLGDSDKNGILAYQSAVNQMVAAVPDGGLLIKNIQEKVLKSLPASKSDINFLNQMVTKMLVMQVPARISELHLNVLNATYTIVQILEMPPNNDELTSYTLSLIAQKNINLISQTVADINAFASAYTMPTN